MEKINIGDFIAWMEANATHPMHANAIKTFKTIRRNKGEIKIDWEHFAKVNGFAYELDAEPEFDSAGFSIADRFEDTEEDTHHCDDPGCNCSI